MKISQEKIIDTAVKIADEKGLPNLTLREIAADLQIKTPSLYNHIQSLDEVYDLIAQRGLRRLTEEVTDAALGPSGKSALYAMARTYRTFASQNPSLYVSTQWVSAWQSAATKQTADRLIQVFIKVLQPFGFSHEKNIQLIRVLRSYLHGFALLHFEMNIDVDASFEYGLSLLIEGI